MTESDATSAQSSEEEIERGRVLTGWSLRLAQFLCVLITLAGLAFVLDLFFYFDIALYREQFFGLLYGLCFSAGFLLFPGRKSDARRRVPIYDYLLAALGLTVGLYVLIAWPAIVLTLGIITSTKVALGAIAILLILELTRRIFGWPLVILAAIFILYAHFNYLLPGALGGRGVSWERLTVSLYLDTGSMLGRIAGVIFAMVFAFILFGRLLFATGGAAFFTDLSLALMGRRRGGPAKVSVIASGLFGTLSGSASSNVVITGQITIPLMKRTGYRASVAAAVESVASSGGSLMPPIMGATAFLIADFIRIPYREIVAAALLPALLYYISLFLQVDLEAAKAGLKGDRTGAMPKLVRVLGLGWAFIVPLGVLIYCLFVVFISPAKSALIAAAVLLGVALLHGLALRLLTGKKDAIPVRAILGTVESTGRLLVEIGVIGAVAGLVIGVVSLTSLGQTFSQILLSVSDGNLWLLLILTAFASIILGMSMPITASYVILAVLAAPALKSAGVTDIAAHLFIFYFALMSFITPPVCVAVYIAAAIARAKPLETAVHAMKLGVVAYIVPFIFVTNEALLLKGPLWEIVFVGVSCIIGFWGLAIALQGHLYDRLATWLRLLIGLGGIATLTNPVAPKLSGMVLVTLCILGLFFLARRSAGRPQTTP